MDNTNTSETGTDINAFNDKLDNLFVTDFVPIMNKSAANTEKFDETAKRFANLMASKDASVYDNEGKYPVLIESIYKYFSEKSTTKNGTRKSINKALFNSISKAMALLETPLTIEQKATKAKNGFFVGITKIVLDEYEEINVDGETVLKDGYIKDDFDVVMESTQKSHKLLKLHKFDETEFEDAIEIFVPNKDCKNVQAINDEYVKELNKGDE